MNLISVTIKIALWKAFLHIEMHMMINCYMSSMAPCFVWPLRPPIMTSTVDYPFNVILKRFEAMTALLI